MSLKQEIETWVTALAYYDNNEFDQALRAFAAIADTSKILFNCGVIHATLGEHQKAVDFFQRAVRLDQYLAVAYFQQGVSSFLLGDFEEALANFNDALLYLRGNNDINYEQLGLKFKLYSCEVLFNRGLCYMYLKQKDSGLSDLAFAAKEKVIPEHDVIDEAIKEQAEGYTVFSIPIGVLYRPNEAKVKNLRSRDYMGKARLVAAADKSVDGRKHLTADKWAVDDRPFEKISFAATNLVRRGLTSRWRQQSEPPMQRSLFPPTPPPEVDRGMQNGIERHDSGVGTTSDQVRRSASARRPQRLELGSAAFGQPSTPERPRLGTVRSASERPRPTRIRADGSVPFYRPTSGAIFRGELDRAPCFASEVTEPQFGPSLDLLRKPSTMSQEQPSRRPRNRLSVETTRSGKSSQRPRSIKEDEVSDIFEDHKSPPTALSGRPEISPATVSKSPYTRQPSPIVDAIRPLAIRKLRVKLRADEDTRYILVAPKIKFDAFEEQVRQKLKLQESGFKIKINDEGDMVTLADQEDWDVAVEAALRAADKVKDDVAKLEVWIQL